MAEHTHHGVDHHHSHAPPPPSINLSITKDDAERIMDASRALEECLIRVKANNTNKNKDAMSAGSPALLKKDELDDNDVKAKTTTTTTSAPAATMENKNATADAASATERRSVSSSGPADSNDNIERSANLSLHSMLLEAASICSHPMISAFFNKMMASGLSRNDAEIGIVLFHEMDKSSKLKLVFDVLLKDATKDPKNPTLKGLSRQGAVSLFKSVLMALSSCIFHQNNDGSNSNINPSHQRSNDSKHKINEYTGELPRKAIKTESSSTPHSPLKTLSSFDSSLAGLKEELDSAEENSLALPENVLRDIENVAVYAADRFVEFAKNQKIATFETFGEWYNSGGCTVVPWLELLHLSKWKTAATEMTFPSTSAPNHYQDEPAPQPHSSPPVMDTHRSGLNESPARLIADDFDIDQRHSTSSSSRTIVSFDFSGAMVNGSHRSSHGKPLKIDITEDNLIVVRNLVQMTNLSHRSASDLCKRILKIATKRTTRDGRLLVTLRREDFRRSLPNIIDTPKISRSEMETLSICFDDFFRCYEGIHTSLQPDEVNAKELAVGLCFLCNGNKSTKLATGFELLDDERSGTLSQSQLMQYLRSYLMMLVGMSFLTNERSTFQSLCPPGRLKDLHMAIENGARWTLGHFLDHVTAKSSHRYLNHHEGYTFEHFAEWYSSGGYNVAQWLELLDLNKLVSLISGGQNQQTQAVQQEQHRDPRSSSNSNCLPSSSSARSHRECRSSHRRQHHNSRASTPPSSQVLFTFPLASQRSLVVLRDDATYVRGVVEQLGLLSLAPEDIWGSLANEVNKRPLHSPGSKPPRSRKMQTDCNRDKTMLVNQETFLDCMETAFKLAGGRKYSSSMSAQQSSIRELLSNFFHSFDLNQTNSAPLNELMGGLTLLCGGKKSTKLAFAFGVFDSSYVEQQTKGGRKGKAKAVQQQNVHHSLNGKDMYLFLRSFLIVMFSCCCQSLDMSNDSVDRCIADTAHMIAEDVMHYQWHNRKKDRVDFDEFGEWYNEGGFEIAPWLELLDLRKWVLLDNFDSLGANNKSSSTQASTARAPAPRAHAPAPVPSTKVTAAPISARSLPPPPTPPPPQPEVYEEKDHPNCPAAPSDDVLDPNFFTEDDNDIMPMDSIDEMDIILMQQDKENDDNFLLIDQNSNNNISQYSPRPQEQEKPVQQSQPSRSQPQSSVGTTNRQRRNNNSLKFHLVTDDDHGGYMLSVSQRRIRHLRQVLTESGLHKIDAEEACNKILGRATSSNGTSKTKIRQQLVISKGDYEAAMRDLLYKDHKGNKGTQQLFDVLTSVFNAFDVKQTGKPINAIEVACGFTVLCNGKKSDKLEFAFEVLDKNKKGKLSKQDMSNYLRSFLTVLLSIACTPSLETDPDEDVLSTMNGIICERSNSAVIRAVEAGSRWAVTQAFKTGLQGATSNVGGESISFDDFAEWYTEKGYTSIPWLELLDLHKWVVTDNNSSI